MGDAYSEPQKILRFLPPMPLALYAALAEAVAKTCNDMGYEAFFTEADGLGVVHIRRPGHQ